MVSSQCKQINPKSYRKPENQNVYTAVVRGRLNIKKQGFACSDTNLIFKCSIIPPTCRITGNVLAISLV